MKKTLILVIIGIHFNLYANDSLGLKNRLNIAYSIGFSNSEYNKIKFNANSKLVKIGYERTILKHYGFIGVSMLCSYTSGIIQQDQLYYSISNVNYRLPFYIGAYIPFNDKISLKISYGFSYNFFNYSKLSNSVGELENKNENNMSLISEIGFLYKINNKHSLNISFNSIGDFNYSNKTNSKEIGETFGLGYNYSF